jgi:cytochrome oxidase assembly protein ShyY1
VRTRLLRPSWLLMHVLLVVALYVMVRLGDWQWGRGEATGSLRNHSYGLEWWAFAVLTLVGWVKFCWDETSPAARDEEPATQTVRTTVVAPVPAEEDPELAAWNARFTELAERDRESSS